MSGSKEIKVKIPRELWVLICKVLTGLKKTIEKELRES